MFFSLAKNLENLQLGIFICLGPHCAAPTIIRPGGGKGLLGFSNATEGSAPHLIFMILGSSDLLVGITKAIQNQRSFPALCRKTIFILLKFHFFGANI